jgi:hypothetical protein
MRDSTTRATVEKPERPEGFRLFAHAACVWAKKVRGKLHYFGPWSDPDGSLNKSLDEKDDLLAGRNPRRRDGLNVGDLCNRFLSAKRALVDAAEMTSRHWGDYYGTCESVVDEFGRNRAVEDLRPEDFQKLRKTLSMRYGPVRLGNEIQRVCTLLKWACDSELIDRPVRTGPDFRKPAKRIIRKARANNGPRMFEPAELGGCSTRPNHTLGQ